MPCRKDVHGSNKVRILFETAAAAYESRLREAVPLGDVTAARAGSARVLRWHGHQPPAVPRQPVVQLAEELAPALGQNSLAQA